MARTVTALWLGLSLLVAANAYADELPESVWLSVEDCSQPTLRLPDAYNALRLELGQAGVRVVREQEREQARAELTAQLRCDQGIRATLRLRAHQDRSSASRLVSLDDTNAKDRARVLALAMAELVRSDWPELSQPADDAPAESAARPSVPADSPPANNERVEQRKVASATENATTPIPAGRVQSEARTGVDSSWHWRADAMLRWFTASPRVLVGPSFALSRGRFSAGLEAGLGRGSTARGVANYGFGAATLGLDALTTEGMKARLAIGPRVALGATWATGQSDLANVQSSDVVQLYADARAEGSLTLRTQAIDIGLRVSGGRANGLRLSDQQKTLGATGGWFMGAAIGAGW